MASPRHHLFGYSGMRVCTLGWEGLTSDNISEFENIAYECMTEAFSKGINCFEISQKHGSELAEIVFGKVFKRAGWERSQFVVSIRLVWNDKEPSEKDVTSAYILNSVRNSLNRLQLSYVDMVFADSPRSWGCMYSMLQAFNEIVKRGLSHYWGAYEWYDGKYLIGLVYEMVDEYQMAPPTIVVPWRYTENDEVVEEIGYKPLIHCPFLMGINECHPIVNRPLRVEKRCSHERVHSRPLLRTFARSYDNVPERYVFPASEERIDIIAVLAMAIDADCKLVATEAKKKLINEMFHSVPDPLRTFVRQYREEIDRLKAIYSMRTPEFLQTLNRLVLFNH